MSAAAESSFVGKYWLYRPLAAGGTATIFLGCLRSDGDFQRAVAIKKLHAHHSLDERVRSALLTEARIVSRIRHPNVAAILDVVADGDDVVVVLEYVHGESLSQLMRASNDAVPLGVALRIMIDALEGLHAAHEVATEKGVPLQVVHRDVSPQNIMVDVDGRARVLDFGIAKALERPFTTEEGEFRGKLAYASPEQVVGARVDRRADIWAAGVVLWELLAARPIFYGMKPPAIIRRLTQDDRPLARPSSVEPAVPPELDAIVARALERDPDARWASARQMALALEKLGPADHRAVGRWVASCVKGRLEERAHWIDEMESQLRRSQREAPVAAPALTADGSSEAARSRATPWRTIALVTTLFAVGASLFAARALEARRRASPALPAEAAPSAATVAPEALDAATQTIASTPPSNPSASQSAAPAPPLSPRTTIAPRGPGRVAPPRTPSRPAPAGSGDPLRMDERQ